MMVCGYGRALNGQSIYSNWLGFVITADYLIILGGVCLAASSACSVTPDAKSIDARRRENNSRINASHAGKIRQLSRTSFEKAYGSNS